MQVRVTHGEQFSRSTMWYVIFGIAFVCIVTLALVGGNILQGLDQVTFSRQSAFGAVLLMGLGRGYWVWAHRLDQQVEIMSLGELGITVGDSTLGWTSLRGFGLEVEKNTQQIHNIILLTDKGNQVHTFVDEEERIEGFITQLADYIPFVEVVPFTWLEKFSRRIKL